MTLAFHLVVALIFYGLAGTLMLACVDHLRYGDHVEAGVDAALTLLTATAAAVALAQALP